MNRKPFAVMIALWLLMGGAGLVAMAGYEKSPGAASSLPGDWPVGSAIVQRGSTLIMFAHPHCPCTRASIGELARIMAQCQGRVTAYVYFFQPTSEAGDWHKTDLWRSAEAIPGVTVQADWDGLESHRFHAATSGQTALYAGGRLLFFGGITGGRGHAGDNPGHDALVAILTTHTGEHARTPVYGCALVSEDNGLSQPAP